jgi:hypothetical protein
MFFILVHGWDGTGWDRFFYAGDIAAWRSGVSYSKWAFAISTPAKILYTFGVIILPVLFLWMSTWIHEGYRLLDVDPELAAKNTRGRITRIIFLLTLGSAILASLLVHLAGWFWGLLVFFCLFYVAGVRRGGLFYRQIHQLTLEPEGQPVAATPSYTEAGGGMPA